MILPDFLDAELTDTHGLRVIRNHRVPDFYPIFLGPSGLRVFASVMWMPSAKDTVPSQLRQIITELQGF